MKRCVQCIMPDTVPGITYDEHGVCSLCRKYVKTEPKGEAAFREILSSLPKGRSYDCAVPLSGGRDSTFVLYLAKKEFGLNPLAVNHDNEFRNPQSVKNMERACQRLGVELAVIRSKRDIAHKIVHCNVRAATNLGLPYVVTAFCRQCDYGYHSVVYIEAAKRGIPLILWGDSPDESTLAVRSRALSRLMRSRYHKLLSRHFYATEFYSLLQRIEFMVSPSALFSRATPPLRNPNMREIRIFDYLPWDRKRIKDTIMNELGWEKPAGHISTWRTDCLLHEITNFFYGMVLACTQDCMGYCNMINSGQMTRAEALAQEEEALKMEWSHVARLLEEHVGLTRRDVERIGELVRTYPRPA
ncbi:MAG: hypothetical protein FJY66_05440 [Calditrichaeota bacterium]|nr:hypothetical protein [Calditrichota bacterium]